ncbi:hypothetical protein AT241_05665 [Bartonella henselae]|nr:hypothetical protein AT241_05665 [Bartonella henselae]
MKCLYHHSRLFASINPYCYKKEKLYLSYQQQHKLYGLILYLLNSVTSIKKLNKIKKVLLSSDEHNQSDNLISQKEPDNITPQEITLTYHNFK